MDDKNNEMLDEVKSVGLKKAIAEISKYSINIGNDNVIFDNAIGINMSNETFDNYSLKRITVKKSIFNECKFIKCALVGSDFTKTTFINCIIDDTSFQFSNLTGTTFSQLTINGSNFSNTNLSYAKLKDINIYGASFVQSLFLNAKIDSCNIKGCTFEDAIFDGAKLSNMLLASLNIEYADFRNVTFNNVYLSALQLPYTFGGFERFFDNHGLHLRSDNSSNKDITHEEYQVLIPYLKIYYESKNQFFPLANIFMYENDRKNFDSTILLGIQAVSNNKSLRDLKHLLKLVIISKWYTSVELRSLYYKIIKFFLDDISDPIYLQEIKSHFGEIYAMLNKQEDKGTIQVRCILEEEVEVNSQKVANNFIQDVMEEMEKSSCKIVWKNTECYKNSPLDILLTLGCENIKDIIECLGILFGIFYGAREMRKNTQSDKNGTVIIIVENKVIDSEKSMLDFINSNKHLGS